MSESDMTHGALEFGLLGPFEASYADTPLALGGRQQRAVLALLVCEAGHPVSIDRLIDGVWGDPAPPGAVTSVQSYVFHLRQLLEPDRPRGTPATVLVTVPGGYRLAVDRQSVDATRFERLVATGDDAVTRGAPGRAVAAYSAADALWRGDVLADLLDYEFAAPVKARLEELRVSALQSRMQAELDLGHHEAAVAELGTLIAEHPLRERFHALRILALYRSGRQSDALAAYRELRSVLDSELGIEPSPPLQQLNNQVLQQDPALDWRPPVSAEPTTSTSSAPVPVEEPPTLPVAPARRSRRRALVLVAAAALGLAGGATLLPTGDTPSASASVAANTVSELDASGSVVASVPVGTNPLGLAAGGGAIWVVNASDDSVSRINPSTHSVEQTVPVGHDPRALAVTDHDVWVTNFADGTVSRVSISAGRQVQTVDVGTWPDAIAAGPAGLWVANSGDNTIQRIDTRTGTPGAAVRVGDGPDGLAVDDMSVWVANGRDGSVTHIDATSGSPMAAPIPVGSGPRGIVRSGNAVWVADELSQSVTRIPVATGTAETFPVGDGPTALAVLGDSVWVAEKYSGDLIRIDRDTLGRHRVDLKAAVHGLAVVGGHLWIASGAFASTSHLGGTLRVAAGELPGHFSVFDPARIYDLTSLPPMRVVYDGLLAYHYSSADPQVLVPDLATAVPEPTDSGLTYIFNLRTGIRYSTGDEVIASDVVRGVQRALLAAQGRPDFYAGIVGGRPCMKHHECDLSQGVVADDASARVTFHLTAPDPEFLYKLTLLVVPTPAGTPLGELTAPLPGTGPYQISHYEKDTALTLTRNRYFHQWSAPAQPRGFVDTITWSKVADAQAAADAVQQGRADLSELTPLGQYDRALGSLVEDLQVEAPSRVHQTTMQATDFGVLNSSIPPFDDIRARRAFNYALDRRQAAKLVGGDPVAVVTCQLLPPTMPGYQPYCPYTAHPRKGEYYGADLAKARDLVRRSGTQGMKVVVTDVVGDYYPPFDALFVDVLRSIGYRATLRELTETPENEDFLFDPHSGVQVESGGWIADFPLPSNFYWLLSCAEVGPGNYTFVHCDEDLDARAAAATDMLQTDPAAALSVWAGIDRDITDQALLLPVANPVDWWLTSDRVGNYQTGLQAIGPLLSQLWVQ